MLFNSFVFIFFYLPVALFGYLLLGRFNHKAAITWLALMSLLFYGYWELSNLVILLVSIGFNYGCGLMIESADGNARKAWLGFAIVMDILALSYYKYLGFFVGEVNETMGWDLEVVQRALPIGISFFSFTQIAFLVDTYQRKVKERNFVSYVLFVSYFPHLIAGPVLHHKEMMPQFGSQSTSKFSLEDISIGLSIFVIGLAKKVLIADNLSVMVLPVFTAGAHPQLIEAWFGSLAYTFQIYFDFSGYSDMAIGLSRLFGIKLPLNFNSPYKSLNIIEFWRRWHMTLSRFLRDYLYIPLGGNRYGNFARYRNLMVTMLLGGMWHGAGWTFIIWGGLHGVYLAINHGWQSLSFLHLGHSRISSALSWAATFLAVVFAWAFFRAPDLTTAIDVSGGMLGFNGISLPKSMQSYSGLFALANLQPSYNGIRWIDFGGIRVPILMGAMVIAWIMPNTQELFEKFKPCIEQMARPGSKARLYWHPSASWAIVISMLFVVCVLNMNNVSEFLYFQF